MFNLKKVIVSFAVAIFLFAMGTGAALAESYRTGSVNTDSLNLRVSPSASSKIVTELSKGSNVTIISSLDNGWYNVKYGNMVGWVLSKFLTVVTSANSGSVIAENVNLREDHSVRSKVLCTLDEGVNVTVISKWNDWYKAKTKSGKIGWIHSEYLSVSNASKSSRGGGDARTQKAEEAPRANISLGQQVAEYGKKFLGVKYVYGGGSASGFDCSGFVKYVYRHFGISLDRVAAGQATNGAKIDRGNLTVGDIVLFDTDGGHNYINHVGIYTGNGKFIHSSSGGGNVMISDLNESFYANSYMTARRVIQ